MGLSAPSTGKAGWSLPPQSRSARGCRRLASPSFAGINPLKALPQRLPSLVVVDALLQAAGSFFGAAAVLLALAILIVSSPALAAEPAHALVGKPAPNFCIKSGDDKTLVPEMFAGKVAVMFYETRETSKKNADIKGRFNRLYDRQDEEKRKLIVRIPVINCSRAVWPATLIWKQSLRSNSKRVGITIYGDWDGRMAKDYQMKDDESNFLIIDRKGIVRYVSFGHISDEQFQEIEKLLDVLVNGEG